MEMQCNKRDPGTPITFYFLQMTRLGMFWLLGGVYFFIIPEMAGWQKIFVLFSIFLFTINHYMYFSRGDKKTFLICMIMDFLVASSFGLIFPQESLFLILFGVVAVTLFLGTDDRRIIYAFGLAFLAVWIVEIWRSFLVTGSIDWVNQLICAAFVLHGCLVGALVRYLQTARHTIAEQYEELHQSHQALQEANDQLRDYSNRVEALTVTRERNHIAREIHDTVGHSMTALLMQLQAAQMLQEQDPEKSKETIMRCEEIARSALQEVRLSVRTLHAEDEQETVLESLRKLLEDFSNMTGVETSLQAKGNTALISPSLQPTIYRLIQESLTNAKRHGQATTSDVILECSEQQIQIEIVDNGKGVAELVPGFGLINMRERILEQGGKVQFSSENGYGFCVKVNFPLQQQAWRFGGTSA